MSPLAQSPNGRGLPYGFRVMDRQQPDRYRTLWQRNLAGVFRCSLAGQILECNDACARIFGFASAEEMVERSTTEFYFDLGSREDFVGLVRRTGLLTNYEQCMRRADGSPVWILENVSLLEENGVEILEGTLIDITERKRTEEALRTSEASYRTLIDHLDQAVFLKDRNLRYVAVNPVFCAGLGLTEDQVRGKTISDLFGDDKTEKSRGIERRVLEEGCAIETDDVIPIAGKPRQVRIRRTPVKDADGTVVGVLGICWDVTDQRSLEAQVRHVHMMNAVGQLAGGIAHEFNNLLTVMLGSLSYALKDGTPAASILELLRNAEKAGLRAAEITRTLVGLSRQATLSTAPVDLNQLVGEVTTLLRPMLPASIRIDTPSTVGVWPAQIDAELMKEALTHVILNARDAMPHGGTLSFQTSHFVPDPDFLARHVEARSGDFVQLRIRDTGVGITAEARQRIFEPFFTTKEKTTGTGLGLAVVFSIVKQHHGWIVCESEPGRGTTFDLFLPRSNSQLSVSPQDSVQGSAAKKRTILLADDERMIRQLTKTVLENVGYQVLLAEDGRAALELFRAHQTDIALVILDAVMPRMSGRDTLRELVHLQPNVLVLFSSGHATEQVDLAEFPQVRGFLAKPYRAHQLVQTVEEILRSSSAPL